MHFCLWYSNCHCKSGEQLNRTFTGTVFNQMNLIKPNRINFFSLNKHKVNLWKSYSYGVVRINNGIDTIIMISLETLIYSCNNYYYHNISVFIHCIHRYVMSYIPGGQTGLKFFTKVFTSIAGKAVSSTLPVWSSKGSKQETPLYKTEEATNLSPLCWWFVKSCDPWGVWVEWFVNFNRNVKVVGSSANMALTCMARHFIHCITPSKA